MIGLCIMVRENRGLYEIHPNAKPESWDEVRAIADSVERIESLVGWEPWTAAYRVHWERNTSTYFVEEQHNVL